MFVTLRHMHQPVGNRLRRSNLAGIAVFTLSFAAVLSTVGCGNQYRPVVSAIGPVGPAGQPEKFAVAVSNPTADNSLGLMTVVDFSGDTVTSTPQILANPSYFQLNANGTQGIVIDPQGSLNTVPLSNPVGLLTSQVVQTTLPVGSNPVSISSFAPASALLTIFIPQAGTKTVAAINAGTAALYDTVGIQGTGTPAYVVGSTGTPRVYAISQNGTSALGQVDAIETVSSTSLSDSAQIPVGLDPVYGVMTTDDRRAFIINQASGTITVLNVPSNALDTLPTGTPSSGPGTIPLCSNPVAGNAPCPNNNPVWADLNTVNTGLVVLNKGDGIHGGSLSVINIPLCNSAAQATNPNCSSTNPVDAAGFGQILATVPVGINPSMVSVLQGTNANPPAAYVINQADSTGTCADPTSGTLTVINLQSNQVVTTICGVSGAPPIAPSLITSNVIFGHPNSVSATSAQPTGKVYVTSSDSTYLSVLYTDTNSVQTHIPLQGNGLRVLVTQP
ncbi:YncE family protein [Granulicella sp. L46]|uniref:YncE family protein n=1 Tax=Granulicella sp. L46 TaxID=1641865 RepID=UPI00131BF97C|nr:YncE family protein [Granulicella sp. L46]